MRQRGHVRHPKRIPLNVVVFPTNCEFDSTMMGDAKVNIAQRIDTVAIRGEQIVTHGRIVADTANALRVILHMVLKCTTCGT